MSLLLSCVLSTHNKRILYCIVHTWKPCCAFEAILNDRGNSAAFHNHVNAHYTPRNDNTTTLSSNLKQTTCKCVYSWSRDKDGGHTIQSAIAEDPMLHANFTALSSTKPELFYTAGKGNFALFATMTLILTW